MSSYDEYFKKIDFDKSWGEADWERFFAAQDRLLQDMENKSDYRRRSGRRDPALSFRQVLAEFGMDPDRLEGEPDLAEDASEDDLVKIDSRLRALAEKDVSYESLPVYNRARCLAYGLSLFVDRRFPGLYRKVYKSARHIQFQKYIEDLLIHSFHIPRLIAQGHTVGYLPENINGNIVRCRMALEESDRCVGIVSRLPRNFLSREEYQGLFRDAVRLRNHLGLWIDTLRDNFSRRVG